MTQYLVVALLVLSCDKQVCIVLDRNELVLIELFLLDVVESNDMVIGEGLSYCFCKVIG